MKHLRNSKGMTLVLLAFVLLVLLIFASLAIDIAYVYLVANELQVATDAAALAGAAMLHDDTSSYDYPIQSAARDAAIHFAAKNKSGNIAVEIVTDNTNTLSPTGNDITVGNWNGTGYTAGAFPINAMEIRPQRVGGLSGNRGPVPLFIGHVFRLIGADWSTMSIRSVAVANVPPRASSYIALCTDACWNNAGQSCTYPNKCDLGAPRLITKGPCKAGAPCTDPDSCCNNACWTSLIAGSTGPGFNLNTIICDSLPYVDVCKHRIYTQLGEDTVTQRNLEADMYDPSYDSGNKQIVNGVVQSWEMIVPVTAPPCPCGTAQGSWNEHDVFGYAKIKIIQVCGPGSVVPCKPFSSGGSCALYGGQKVIVISEIQCVSCADALAMQGLKPVLVK